MLRNRLEYVCEGAGKRDLGLKAHRSFGGDRPEIFFFLRFGMHTCRYFVRSTLDTTAMCLSTEYV